MSFPATACLCAWLDASRAAGGRIHRPRAVRSGGKAVREHAACGKGADPTPVPVILGEVRCTGFAEL
ncbi:MAG TPA: hypothetical protein VFL57_00535 [Bryobacteraceae bacterium]|nr:hypothetical protein [Bryobacteraceae bacterium]